MTRLNRIRSMGMFNFIAIPLGQFLYFIYNNFSFHNYGLAIIIFTVIIRLVLLPLTVKQYKSTAQMQLIQPQIQEIQRRFKNDRERMNVELQKVYKENNVNPASGCLPLLIQLPILLSLYWVITQPLKYMLGKSAEAIQTLINTIPASYTGGGSKELGVLDYFSQFPEKLSEVGGLLTQGELINLNFLGLNLGKIPTLKINLLFSPEASTYLPLLLLPVIAVIATYISAKMMMPKKSDSNNKKKKNEPDMAGSMQNSML
jgi:YidC/Oxa1 family membrane protein insertase